MKQMPK